MTNDKRPVVLVVEDDQSISNLIRINLDLAGFTPVMALDGDRAVEVFSNTNVDLVLLDLMLPGKDGWEVLAYIKEKSGGKVPVIITSAKTQKIDVSRGFESGATDYVTKPFDPFELIGKIKEILKKKSNGA